MRTYDIKIVGDSFDWKDIPTINIDNAYFDTPDSIKAYAQIASGTDGLKVHLWTTEPERRAEETGPIGSPCEDSCLEFFFAPMGDDKRYFNVEFNSNGCVFLGFGSSIKDLVRLMLHNNTSPLVPEIRKDDKGWEIFYTFPFEFIRRFFPDFEVYEGKEIIANCYKCSDLGKYPHYLAWSPIVGEPFKFHRTECFGKMKFVK